MVKMEVVVKKPDGTVDLERSMLSLRTRGKIGGGSGFGFARFGHVYFGDTRPGGGIYRKKYTGYNQYGYSPKRKRRTIYQRMRYYRPTDPKSDAQLAQRAKLTAANIAWRELDPVEKSRYIERAKRVNRVPRNFYISWYIKNH